MEKYREPGHKHPIRTLLSILLTGVLAVLAKPDLSRASETTGTRSLVSIVSLKDLASIYKEVLGLDYIPFQYLETGCDFRAHEIARHLESKSIYVGKAYAEGKMLVRRSAISNDVIEWAFHIAPLIKVKTRNGILDFVIDPALFTTPVSLDVWQKKLTELDGSHAHITTHDRFFGGWNVSIPRDSKSLNELGNVNQTVLSTLSYFKGLELTQSHSIPSVAR